MTSTVIFGQLVIGPPGSGKTTYCNGLQQFLKETGRKVVVVNIGSAQSALRYTNINLAQLSCGSCLLMQYSPATANVPSCGRYVYYARKLREIFYRYCSEFWRNVLYPRFLLVPLPDPANDNLPYECGIDISKLVTVDDVMEELTLGPNGGLVYCMEYLEKNLDWLFSELENYKDYYVLFDCPGQVELYTYHNSVQNITKSLSQNGFRLCAVHLVDSHYCTDPGNFVAVLLTSLSAMLKLELPHVNILSKVDLIEKYDKLSFGIDFYTEVLDLTHLLEQLSEDGAMKKYKKLNSSLVELIESYGLVSFVPLNIQDKQSVLNVVQTVDKANGYVFGWSQDDRNIQKLLSTSSGADFAYCKNADIREKLISDD